MKYIAFLLFVAFQTVAEKPEVIQPRTKEIRPVAWYAEQMALWKQEVNMNRKNANAWYNYFSASKFSLSGRDELDRIITEMEANIPDSYEFYLSKGMNLGLTEEGYSNIKKAYQLNPERPETYAMLLLFAELNQDNPTRKEFSKKLYASGQVARSLISYHYNVLMSIGRVGIFSAAELVGPFGFEQRFLFTDGESTTLPVFLLQDVLNVGNEVTLLSLELLENADYRNKKFQTLNLKSSNLQSSVGGRLAPQLCSQLPIENDDKIFYYALTLLKENIAPIRDNLYVVGLASQFSRIKFDNLILIERNMGNQFMMDYLKVDFDKESEFSAGKILSSNYFVPMLLLREFYVRNSSYKGDLEPYIDPRFVFQNRLISDPNSPYNDEHLKLQFNLMSVANIERQRNLVTRLYNRGISERYATFDPESKALEVSLRPINTKLYAGEYEITNELFNRFLAYLQKQGMNDLYERYKIDLSQYSEPALSFMKNYSTARIVTKKEKYFTQYPAVSISYEAANAYCDWLTEQYNKTPGKKFLKVKFRLPTVNEWQIAALGYKEFTSWIIDENMVKVLIPDKPDDPFGKGTEKTISVKDNEILYPWFKWYNFRNSAVNNKGCYLGNFKVPENVTPCQPTKMNTADGFLMMSSRGAYFPNDMGLYDVVGNVAEMTSEKGIAVGGSWNHAPEQSTIRSINEYSKPEAFVGFRVFMEVVEQ